eukprot:1161363-Pelagomonas_calceolata.AAC.9
MRSGQPGPLSCPRATGTLPMHAGTRTQTQGAEKSCPWCAAFHVPSWAWVMLEGAVVKVGTKELAH